MKLSKKERNSIRKAEWRDVRKRMEIRAKSF